MVNITVDQIIPVKKRRMVKLHRKATFLLFALLLVSATAYAIAHGILPALGQGNTEKGYQTSGNVLVDPDSPVVALAREMPSIVTSMAEEVDQLPLEAAFDTFQIIADIRDEAELISQYIRKQNKRIDELTALQEAFAFIHYSTKYDVPLDLAIAVANTESHFDPQAKSGHGSAGVMQVTWRVHSALLQANGINSEEDLHDPVQGIAAGTLLLSRYLKAYDTTEKALGRYYGGSASVYWSRISRNLARLKKYTR